MNDAEAILRWLLALTVISTALAPAVWWLGRGLDSSASALIRTLPLVLLTAIVWWPAALFGLPYSTVILAIVLAIAGAALWGAWLGRGLEIPWRSALAFESVWLFLFSTYIFFRSYQPNIANTEKPMEIAFLSSVSRSTSVPAPDPWFAGEAINYYYFGYQMIATLVKLTGVPTGIAFNLALATLFASVGTIAAGIGYRVARATRLGTLPAAGVAAAAGFLVLLAGNLEAFWRMLRDPAGTWASGWWYDGVGWQASRVIVDHNVHGNPDPRNTINEFPAFSFVLGDLHPHVLTYPLFMSVLALAVGVTLVGMPVDKVRAGAFGALAGLLYVSNSWDAPTGVAFVVAAILLTGGWRNSATWLNVGVSVALAGFVAAPFVSHFTPPVGLDQTDLPGFLASIPVVNTIAGTIGIVTWRPSGFGELLIVHGHWMVAFLLFVATVTHSSRDVQQWIKTYRAPILGGLVAIVIPSLLWVPALLLVGVPAAIAIVIARRTLDTTVRLIAGLFAIGFGLVLIPEFFYIQDAFNDRMNTVFKLYFQAWLPLGIAAAATLGYTLASQQRVTRAAGMLTIGALVVATMPYLPVSARDWTGDFFVRYGLDGSAYIERSHPDDAAAVLWLDTHAGDGDVIVEAPGCSYGSVSGIPMNRFSAFTGIPTLVGWEGHERQWRRGEADPIDPRITSRQVVANRWLDGDITGAPGLPDASFIVLGSQEASGSPGCEPLTGRDTSQASARLQQAGWAVVFESGNTRILARP